MNLFTETALKNFCSSHSSFGKSSTFVRFERGPESNKDERNGYNSGMIFGRIVYRTEENEEKLSEPVALKIAPLEHLCKEYMQVQYFNEIFFYTRILPIFRQLSSLETLVAKFYDSYIRASDQSTEMLLMYEDLKAAGFRNHQRYSFLDLDHLKLMLHKLGQFHSYSYMMKSQNAAEFQALGNWFQYPDCELIRSAPKYFRLHGEVGVRRLRRDPQYSSRMAMVEKVLATAEAFMIEVNTAQDQMSVLVHGDYLRGNVMFRYENQQLVDMKMIDMATCRIASPVIDLSLVLYLNANQQTRNRHWNELIDIYYQGLCQKFGGIGIPSKEDILKEFTYKALHGYFIASHFLQVCMELDLGNLQSDFVDLIPEEYKKFSLAEIPEEVLEDIIERLSSEVSAEAMADILRDMIDRNFI